MPWAWGSKMRDLTPIEIKTISNCIYALEQDAYTKTSHFEFTGKVVNNVQEVKEVITKTPNPEGLVALAEFTLALENMSFKEWHIYKQEYSKIMSMDCHGRFSPIHKSKGPKASLEMGKIYNANMDKKPSPFAGALKLQGLKPMQRLKAIMAADMPDSVKKEFLDDLKALF